MEFSNVNADPNLDAPERAPAISREGQMTWIGLIQLTSATSAGSGGAIAVGRRVRSPRATLVVHLFAAATLALAPAAHARLAPDFGPAARAAAMTGPTIALDRLVAAPLFERSHAMLRSPLGTWIPFAAILVANWAASRLV